LANVLFSTSIYGKKPNTKYFSPNINIFQYLLLMNKKGLHFSASRKYLPDNVVSALSFSPRNPH